MSASLRWKCARILLDRLKCILYGWDCRTERLTGIPVEWHQLSCFHMPIRLRPELGGINANRIDNMRKACACIAGTVVGQGRVFSLYRIIGDPTEDRGYKPGPMIACGRLSLSIGGGLCQISTSLFNAALLANLEIIEKRNHTTDLWGEYRMIDLGRDAAYSYALSDLKFRNTTGKSIAIDMSIDEQALQLSCSISGPDPLTESVRILSTAVPILGRNKTIDIRTTRIVTDIHMKDVVTYRKTEHYRIPEKEP